MNVFEAFIFQPLGRCLQAGEGGDWLPDFAGNVVDFDKQIRPMVVVIRFQDIHFDGAGHAGCSRRTILRSASNAEFEAVRHMK